MSKQPTIGIIGGGSWGTALAIAANRAGSSVTLATRNENVIAAVNSHRTNDIYLPEVFIDPAITVTENLRDACATDIVIMAVPSHCMRSASIAISDILDPHVPIVVANKGVEKGSLLLMTEVAHNVLPKNPLAVISGPNYAREVALGQPTATTIACVDTTVGKKVQFAIGSKFFRPYLSDDVIGTQIGGAVKNVIAIACGIAFGKQLGENARSAIMTRGFAEMTRLCLAKGGKLETLSGLSGLGDLILTCGSPTSRNTSFGMALCHGRQNLDQEVETERRGVIEGAISAESVVKLAVKHGIDMPISQAVHRIVNEGASVEDTISTLLDRPLTAEVLAQKTA